jgi:hypothetical protein
MKNTNIWISLSDWHEMISEELSINHYAGFALFDGTYLVLDTRHSFKVKIFDGDTINKHLLKLEEEKIKDVWDTFRKKQVDLTKKLFIRIAEKYVAGRELPDKFD